MCWEHLFQADKRNVTRYSETGFGELKNWGTATTLFEIPNQPDFVWLPARPQQVSLRRFKHLSTQNPVCRAHVLLHVPANSLNASIKGDGTSLSCPETLCHATLSPSSLSSRSLTTATLYIPTSGRLLSPTSSYLHTSMLWGFVFAPWGLAKMPAGSHLAAPPNATLCTKCFRLPDKCAWIWMHFGDRSALGFKTECILASAYSLFTVQPQQNPDFTDYWLI